MAKIFNPERSDQFATENEKKGAKLMKKVFRTCSIAVCLMFVMSAFGAVETRAQVLNEILNRMDRHYKSLASLSASVTREKTNVQLKETDRYQGSLLLLPKKGKALSLRLDWIKPKREVLSVVNGRYVAYIPAIKRAYTGSSASKTANDKGSNVLSVMSMSKDQLKANYTVQYLGEEKIAGGVPTWRLKLTPKTAAQYKYAELWVDGNGMPLQGKVVALNDDTDTFLLQTLLKNKKIKGSVFAVKIPKGTEVLAE